LGLNSLVRLLFPCLVEPPQQPKHDAAAERRRTRSGGASPPGSMNGWTFRGDRDVPLRGMIFRGINTRHLRGAYRDTPADGADRWRGDCRRGACWRASPRAMLVGGTARAVP